MKRKLLSLFIISALGVFFVSLIPSIKYTIKLSGSFYDLVILSTLSEKPVSKNPYSKGFCWVGPKTAYWILKNCEYPHKSCDKKSVMGIECSQPKISWVGRGIGILDLETENRMYELLAHLIKRGKPLDAYTNLGFTALHEAVLYNQKKYAKFLIDAGANPYLKATKAGSAYGKNVF